MNFPKKIILALVISLSTFLVTKDTFAQSEDFDTTLSIEYEHANDAINAKIRGEIINKKTEVYADKFSILVEKINPENLQAFDETGEIPIEFNKDEQKIYVTFPEKKVGKGKAKEFNITFSDPALVKKEGEVTEITLPKITQQISTTFNTKLTVSKKLGKLAYISPQASEIISSSDTDTYVFNKNETIVIIFGQFQTFTFSLTYHLENKNKEQSSTQIAIPPDTSFQKVGIKSLTPIPQNIIRDDDGNWLANYLLKPNERVDVKLEGNVQLFSESHLIKNEAEDYLKSLTAPDPNYWQSNDPTIVSIAQKLNSPKEIYDYVINTLSYDYERVKPDIERKGALKSLSEPYNSICMEFTDLFIALARARGIPAREVNGYAYTENSRLYPVSLVADVLHSWPEYWNSEKKVWIPVDPTWADTTGGLDYFTKPDLRHISFVIHGKSSTKPYAPGSYKLGVNPQKDIYVAQSSNEEPKEVDTVIELRKIKSGFFSTQKYKLTLINNGPNAVYEKRLTIKFDDQEKSEEIIHALLPLERNERIISLPRGILGVKFPDSISASYNSEGLTVNTKKNDKVIIEIISLLAFILLISLAFFLFVTNHNKKQNE